MAIRKEWIMPGDILLWKVHGRSNLLAKLIGFFSVILGQGGSYHREYAHAAICENNEYCLEMTWPRSKRSKIKYNDDIELWRIRGITKEKAIKAIEWAKSNLGIPYNLLHLLTFGILGGFGCSDFVAKAYANQGIILSIEGKEDKVVSPNEIADSKLTIKIGGF